MLITIIKLIAGCTLLLLCGDWLVNGGTALARRFRISPLVIGMTIVAFGTSAPELLVSTIAALKGSSGIALGNVVGSNIANIGLILGLTALILPIPASSRSLRVHGLVMTAAGILLALFAISGSRISRIEGLLMVAALGLFLFLSIAKGRQNDTEDDSADGKDMGVIAALALIILSCAGLALGADLLVDSASDLARSAGVSERVIGLTVVALGTSLPELAASVIAAIKKQMDISIGNVIGSNIFNILCVLGLSSAIQPIEFNLPDYYSNYAAMMLYFILLLGFIFMAKKIGRLSGGLLFIIYIAFVALLF